MPEQIYNWKRYWYPQGSQITLLKGFLCSSRSVQQTFSPHKQMEELCLFESIAEIPCLILLGEPGMGKSEALKDAYQSFESKIKGPNDEGHLINLADYTSESYLAQELFLNDFFVNWSSGTHRLHLFLDSLDEVRLRLETVTNLLDNNLKKHRASLGRLFLRIACRTSDWPSSFEEKLRILWGDNSVKAYVLAPLQREDVAQAAQSNLIDTNAFLRDLLEKEVGAFAARPITLEFLLRLYRDKQQLPNTRYDLYLKGCKELCREINEPHKKRDSLQPEERFVIAARIAACTVFTNRYRITTQRTWDDDPDKEYMTIEELAGGNESTNEVSFPIYEAKIKETLQTALFSEANNRQWAHQTLAEQTALFSEANDRQWAHQTLAEFLAAWYAAQNMTLTQIKSLIFHPDGKLVPQLHETATWLASLRDDIFWEIIKTDPHVLLRSDYATGNVQAKEKLTNALLKRYEEGAILDVQLFEQYAKLEHPDLAKKLRPYLEDKNNDARVRHAAVKIAGACKQSSLEDVLVEISLNRQESVGLRQRAADAVLKVGHEEAKAKLKPLALLPLGEQTKYLIQSGIEAVWPKHLTTAELFHTFSLSWQDYYLNFDHTLPDLIMQYLTPSDLPIALAWVEQEPWHNGGLLTFRSYLMDLIMRRAWEWLESPQIIESFTKVVSSRLLKYGPIFQNKDQIFFGQMIRNEDKKRRQILRTAIPILLNSGRISHVSHDHKKPLMLLNSMAISSVLTNYNFPLVLSQDTKWLVEQFLLTNCEKTQGVFSQLILKFINRIDEEQLNFLYEACESHPNLQEALGYPFDAISLDSEYVQRQRDLEAERQKREQELKEIEEKQKRQPLKPTPMERVIACLEECESGQHQSWWRLSDWMMFEKDGRYMSHHQVETDLTILPVWKELNDEVRLRVIEAAKDYILTSSPSEYEWLESEPNKIYHPVIAGYRAFRLLPNFISTLPKEIWERWAAVILYYSYQSLSHQPNEESQTSIKALLALAYQYVPYKIIEALMQIIDLGHVKVSHCIDELWDKRLEQAILNKAKDKKLTPRSMGILLDQLLQHGCQAARQFAESLICLPISDDEDGLRLRAKVAAACSLIQQTTDAGWSIVWPAFQTNHNFGREVVKIIAPVEIDYRFGQKLSESQLSDFYIWLTGQFPPDKVSKLSASGVRPLTILDRIDDFRSYILDSLRQFGTKQACNELQHIASEFPDLDLSWSITKAQELYRRKTWIPPQPKQVIELAQNQQAHWGQSGSQLLDVIVELLDKLNRELQGQNGSTPAAIDLWNENPEYKPFDENRLSDYVERYLKRELEGKGIFIGREVQTRRGSFTDIYVETFVRHPNGNLDERITLVIEVKGCWHKELKTAMKTQLAERYLEQSSYRHGLYLVGWFLCDKWDKSDYRKGNCPKYDSFEKALKEFTNQADELSKNELDVRAFLLDLRLS